MKLRLTILSVLSCLYFVLHAQTPDNAGWCPPGATWTYHKNSFGSNLFYQYIYEKDTLIAFKNAKKLAVIQINFIGPGGNVRTVSQAGYEYFYNSNDSIFFLDSGSFRFMYDFNATAGQQWVIGNDRPPSCSVFPGQDTVLVSYIRKDTIGNRIYERIMTTNTYEYFQLGTVIKNIGAAVSPYPALHQGNCCMMQNPGGACDLPFWDRLVCYSDNIRGIVPVNNPTLSCFTITSLFEPDKNQSLIYPNPALDFINIEGIRLNSGYTITDIQGKIISQGILKADKINIAQLRPGVYVIKITSGKVQRISKFVKR
jgi:hypothetical protein